MIPRVVSPPLAPDDDASLDELLSWARERLAGLNLSLLLPSTSDEQAKHIRTNIRCFEAVVRHFEDAITHRDESRTGAKLAAIRRTNRALPLAWKMKAEFDAMRAKRDAAGGKASDTSLIRRLAEVHKCSESGAWSKIQLAERHSELLPDEAP